MEKTGLTAPIGAFCYRDVRRPQQGIPNCDKQARKLAADSRRRSAIEADGENSPSGLAHSNQTRNSKHAAKDLARDSRQEIYSDIAAGVLWSSSW
jgi:hypothetical protein